MISQKNEEYPYTYADYYSWDDGERWELIEGVAYAMSPGASWRHQDISFNISYKLRQFLDGKRCKVLYAPVDVRLNADSYDDTVVQPDIIVVCDKMKLRDSRCCIGAPDMIVEILSPSSLRHDKLTKFNLYQQYGVREYWIADPSAKMMTVHILEPGKYVTSVYGETDTVPVHVLEGCVIDLADVFVE